MGNHFQWSGRYRTVNNSINVGTRLNSIFRSAHYGRPDHSRLRPMARFYWSPHLLISNVRPMMSLNCPIAKGLMTKFRTNWGNFFARSMSALEMEEVITTTSILGGKPSFTRRSRNSYPLSSGILMSNKIKMGSSSKRNSRRSSKAFSGSV